jgi:hypothetical protein
MLCLLHFRVSAVLCDESRLQERESLDTNYRSPGRGIQPIGLQESVNYGIEVHEQFRW